MNATEFNKAFHAITDDLTWMELLLVMSLASAIFSAIRVYDIKEGNHDR